MSGPVAPGKRTTNLTTVALGLLVLLLAAGTVWTSLDVSRSSRRANADLTLGTIYQDIRSAVADEGAAGLGYRDHPEGAKRRLAAAQSGLRDGVAELRRSGTAADRAIVPYIVANELHYQWATRDLLEAIEQHNNAEAERIGRLEMGPAYRTVQRLVDLAARVHRDRALKAISGVSHRSGRFVVFVSLAYAAGFVLLGACAYFLLRLQGALHDMVASQHELARRDPLTGLPNSRHWQETIAERLSGQAHAAVLLLDLDGFKDVNDTLGHEQGDAVLKIVAGRLADTMRSDDFVARMGGDEFAVFLPATEGEGAARVAGNIATRLAEPCDLLGVEVRPCASIGIAVYPDDGTDEHALLRHADRAMYAAKTRDQGRERAASLPVA